MMGRMIFADSEHSADMFYATRFFVPDPFLFVQEPSGTRHVVISALEIDRARRVAKVEQVHDLAAVKQRFKDAFPLQEAGEADLIAFFLKELSLSTLEVPADFPLAIADALRTKGLSLAAAQGTFWPQRAFKQPDEVEAIRQALAITGQGMMAGIEIIRSSQIGSDGLLYLAGEPLTSERVRGEIDATLARLGAMPQHTIVAGGQQGSDPHEAGYGPLAAHTSIILDVFPRIGASGYYGDMTRTVCRGTPSERLAAAWQAVMEAQNLAFQKIKAKASGLTIHQELVNLLTQRGFPTAIGVDGRQGGFFHGTGHGLGLEIHEAPRIGARDHTLEEGHVVTVEPGLYYPDMGGVRLEDVVLVTANGCENLTRVPKFFLL
ncbi:MAG: aminopeptidase P family protein [Magnetococcales bacterium]|nr:aminopeptidase P family protein [Magnetococcales bacterium]NGZ25367.1 aminopeptidase P family protein [Magnetococcales bacterium]